MFKKILVPVDLTDKNQRAVDMACELIAPKGEVTLFHVIETLAAPFDELVDFYQGLETTARERLESLAAPLRARSVTHQTRVVYGKRAPEIVSFADENKFDLIIITSHPFDPEHMTGGFLTISHQVAIAAPTAVLALR
jgi:nucleotide-binding universal stress UspA family protein